MAILDSTRPNRLKSIGRPASGDFRTVRGVWLQTVAWVAVFFWVAAAGLLLGRRLAGAFADPLDGLGFSMLCVALVAPCWLIRRTIFPVDRSRLGTWFPGVILLSANLAIGLALWLPGTPWWSVVLGALLVFVAELECFFSSARRPVVESQAAAIRSAVPFTLSENGQRERISTELSLVETDLEAVSTRQEREAESEEANQEVEAWETALPPRFDLLDKTVSADPDSRVTQQLVRWRGAENEEGLTGSIRVEIPEGGRMSHVHLAFCPAFAHRPQLEVEQIDGPPSRLKTPQVLSYGARIDLKLTRAAEGPTWVLLHFTASAKEPMAKAVS